MSTVAKRYASAAVEAAFESSGEEALRHLVDGLGAFIDAYTGSAELKELVNNPGLSGEREESLGNVATGLGLSAVASGLVRVLVRNERIDELEAIYREVKEMAYQKLGRRHALVTSAIEVSPEQKKRIEAALSRQFDTPVDAEIVVDPSIEGGLVCTVGDVQIDLSVRRQIDNLTHTLMGRSGH